MHSANCGARKTGEMPAAAEEEQGEGRAASRVGCLQLSSELDGFSGLQVGHGGGVCERRDGLRILLHFFIAGGLPASDCSRVTCAGHSCGLTP